MMGLFFLVVCAVGILRPIKNALALDGLGATDFYKVYLVSAIVVLFVPAYNRLANRLPSHRLIPAVAVFFALNLVLLRAVYVDGSTVFGLVFYGWYDLFAAALVTQFFMVTQLFFDARSAKSAYPIVIAGGSIGATLGGGFTGFMATRVGTPNLLLVAAGLILAFAVGIPYVLKSRALPARKRTGVDRFEAGELRGLLANPHIRLIAALVLITVLAKQLVDYQFNTLTKEVFQERDAITAFQGKFNAATQWLPLVALAGLQPLLRRFGMVAAVLMLPAMMVGATVGLVLFWGLWAAVFAKGAETSLRYSAERAGREILYVPVPEDLKLRAKAYIDVAVEKGIGKAASGLLIPLLLLFMDYRQTAWVGLGLSLLWLTLALRSKREYVHTLRAAMEGRFASLRGVFASLLDATTLPVVRKALASGDPARAAFALDLAGQAPASELRSLEFELTDLLGSPHAGLRTRAAALIGRLPETGTALQAAFADPDPEVRDAAVSAFLDSDDGTRGQRLAELLRSTHAQVRTAALGWLVANATEDELAAARAAYAPAAARDEEAVVENALAAAALRVPDAALQVGALLDHADARVANAALRAAGWLREESLVPRMVSALRRPETREAARSALAACGEAIVPALAVRLLDVREDPVVRRSIPSVLARIPSARTIEVLLEAALATETDQVLDYRLIKALGKLRAAHPELPFPVPAVERLVAREVAAARRYAAAHASAGDATKPRVALLRRALSESVEERRETAFRALGLVHTPDGVHRCFQTLRGNDGRARANAIEWLETTLGHAAFRQIEFLTTNGRAAAEAQPLEISVRPLTADEDAWIARCAAATLGGEITRDARYELDLIERVFLLQNVDLLREAKSAHLAMLASIAEEVDVKEGEVLVSEGAPADALYVVLRGKVSLHGVGGTLTLEDGAAFGTWSLIDDAPSLVEARAAGPGRLLRITRESFQDLVVDHPELAIGLLQGLARRVRTLVA